MITSDQISAIIGRSVVPDSGNATAQVVNEGETADEMDCLFETEGDLINDLMVRVIVSQHEMNFFDEGHSLGPISGLGPKAYVTGGGAGGSAEALTENALLLVSYSNSSIGLTMSANQLQSVAAKAYAGLTGG